MSRLGFAALFAGCVLSVSCGGYYFVGFVSNPGGGSSVSGIVSAVSSGFISDPTGFVTPFTTVTFIEANGAINVNFCGDQEQWFPINKNVQAEFTPGIHCNVLVNVVVNNDFETSHD